MMDLMDKYLLRVKPEVREKGLEPISDEDLQDVFLETMSKVNKSYIEGAIYSKDVEILPRDSAFPRNK